MREHAGPPVPLGLVSVSGARHRMTSIIVTLSIVLAVLVAAIVALLALLWRRVGADRALRKSEAFFRHLADDAPMVMWTTRPDTTLDYLNKFSVEFTGMPLQELLDEGWLNAVHPDDRDRIQRVYIPAIEARQPVLMEYRLRRADGVYRWVLDSGVPKYEKDGSYTGYVGCSFDITERKDAEDALRGESSRSSTPGWPTDRGAGCRKGADRAGPARRRQSATGWGIDRIQRFQAAARRISRQQRAAPGTRGASTADTQTRAQRSTALSRSPSDRAPASRTGEGPDLVLWGTRPRTRWSRRRAPQKAILQP